MNRNTIKKIIASGLIIVTTVVFAEINNNGLKMPGNITFNSIVEAEEISTGNTEAVKEDKSKVLPEVKNYSLKQSNINILSGKSGNVTVSWTKNSKANGYQIQYSTDQNFVNSKIKTIKGQNKNSTKLAKLNSKKNYYVRVRGYAKKGRNKYYSDWSSCAEIISWNSKWEFASYSKIHTDSAALYFSSASKVKNKTVCINAGHGTKGGESVKTLCHPDGSAKVTGGSTAQGAIRATSINGGSKGYIKFGNDS